MNLLFFTSQYPFEGGEAFVEDEIDEISKYFDQIMVFTYAKSESLIRKVPHNAEIIRTRDYDSISINILAFLRLFSYKTLKEIVFLKKSLKQKITIKKLHYIYMYYKEEIIIRNLLHNHDFSRDLCYSYWFGSRAYVLSQIKNSNPGMRYVCRAHRVDSIPTNYNPFRREILSNVNSLYPISEKAKSEIEETKKLSGVNRDINICVSRLGIKKDDETMSTINDIKLFRIVSCSSIIHRKRLDLIIEAIAGLEESSYRIEWVHFGDGIESSVIKDLAVKRLSGKQNIAFYFKGNTDKHLILKYYSKHQIDVFINASDSEGVPVSIMEALSYGIPCICRNIGGNSEIVENGINGYLLDDDDPLLFTEAIKKIMHLSSENKEIMRSRAYEIYEKKYNAKNNYRIHAMYLMNVLKE